MQCLARASDMDYSVTQLRAHNSRGNLKSNYRQLTGVHFNAGLLGDIQIN